MFNFYHFFFIANRILMSTSKLTDSYDGSEPSGTNEAALNSYSTGTQEKRIDYILYRSGAGKEATVQKYSLPFPHRILGGAAQSVSFSDHEAVTATIRVVVSNDAKPSSDPVKEKKYRDEFTATLMDCVHVCDESILQLRSNRLFYVSMAVAALIVLCTIMDFIAPYGLKWLFVVARILLVVCIVFNVVMATVWNLMERNGVLAGKLAMEVRLHSLLPISLEPPTGPSEDCVDYSSV